MTKRPRFGALLVGVLTLSPTAARAAPIGTLANEEQEQLRELKQQTQKIIALLKDARPSAPPDVRRALDHALDEVERFQRAPTDLKLGFAALADSARVQARLRPDDFETQLQVATALFSGSNQAESVGLDARAQRREAVALTRALVTRFPAEGRAYGQLALVEESTGGDLVDSLRMYAKCLKLDPSASFCARNYRSAVASYRMPHCAAADVRPDLAFHVATDDARKGTRPATWRDRSFNLEDRPLLTAHEFRELYMADGELHMQLAPGTEQRISRAVRHAGDQPAPFLVLMAGNRVLQATRFELARFEQPSLRLRGGGLKLEDVCRHIEQRTLPADLPVP
jgi:hypothetical protein